MIKIVKEDRELEEAAMNGELCIAVPFEIFVPEKGDAEITVYSDFTEDAEEFAERFAENPFGEAAMAFVKERFQAPMLSAGYEYDGEYCHHIVHFTAGKIVCTKPGFDTELVKISTNKEFEKYYNCATRDIELDDDDENDVCFAVVKNDMILSFAAVNDISDNDFLEINVETASNARCRGFGTAVVSALAEYLVSKGEKVSYKCRIKNEPSLRLAEKAGFVRIGESYDFVCYQN